jgi:hypothetical protein
MKNNYKYFPEKLGVVKYVIYLWGGILTLFRFSAKKQQGC